MARELATAAGDVKKYGDYIGAARTELEKGLETTDDLKKVAEEKKVEEEPKLEKAADEKKPTEDWGVRQVWMAKDGSTHDKKADALAKNAEVEAAQDPLMAKLDAVLGTRTTTEEKIAENSEIAETLKKYLGEEAWDALRVHPKILQYVLSRSSTAVGPTPLMVDEATIAAAFRLERVLIGQALYNTSAEGAAASYSRVWGKSCALIRVESSPSPRRTQTFGYTFRFGAMETSTFYEGKPGRAGGTYIKVAHSDADEVVAGSSAGYLYTTVVS
jgi:hypothetical protein